PPHHHPSPPDLPPHTRTELPTGHPQAHTASPRHPPAPQHAPHTHHRAQTPRQHRPTRRNATEHPHTPPPPPPTHRRTLDRRHRRRHLEMHRLRRHPRPPAVTHPDTPQLYTPESPRLYTTRTVVGYNWGCTDSPDRVVDEGGSHAAVSDEPALAGGQWACLGRPVPLPGAGVGRPGCQAHPAGGPAGAHVAACCHGSGACVHVPGLPWEPGHDAPVGCGRAGSAGGDVGLTWHFGRLSVIPNARIPDP